MNVRKAGLIIVNGLLGIITALSVAGFDLGIDKGTLMSCVAGVSTILNGGAHALNAGGQ